MKMPFGKLMEHVAALSGEDEALTLGELSVRWGEPSSRIGDAIDAVRVLKGERTYVTVGDDQTAHYKRLFALQQQARDLGRDIITGGGFRGAGHYGAVTATYPQGGGGHVAANEDSWRCHHDHPGDVSALECALGEVRRLGGGGSYELCSAGPDCQDEECRRDWERLTPR